MKAETDNLTESLISEEQPQLPSPQSHNYMQKLPTINGINCIQTLLFTWLYPFLSFGSKTTVTVQTMPQLSQSMLTAT